MAKPRVFVSSTYYDLKHIRSSLDNFIASLGFESILSEKGDIAYAPDLPLDESCYREAAHADILVLVIGGKYGSEASSEEKLPKKSFYQRYESITKKELESALERDVPTYILVEAQVYSEYQTYLRNRENPGVRYAHVDSVNIFALIEEILTRPRNNPVHTFEKFADIETWLCEQWAGLFRELLQRRSEQQQLATLTSQVSDLREINDTLRKYLEAVMTGVDADASKRMVEDERKRLDELERRESVRRSHVAEFFASVHGVDTDAFIDAVKEAASLDDFAARIAKRSRDEATKEDIYALFVDVDQALAELNEVRQILSKERLILDNQDVNR